MKALRKLKPGYGAELVDIPIPSIEADEVLIKVKATALCKSDIDVYNWTPLVASANYRLPLTMGHEFLGEIVEVGNAVRTLKVGEHVVGKHMYRVCAVKAVGIIICIFVTIWVSWGAVIRVLLLNI